MKDEMFKAFEVEPYAHAEAPVPRELDRNLAIGLLATVGARRWPGVAPRVVGVAACNKISLANGETIDAAVLDQHPTVASWRAIGTRGRVDPRNVPPCACLTI